MGMELALTGCGVNDTGFDCLPVEALLLGRVAAEH
jgi:hypothetical protein